MLMRFVKSYITIILVLVLCIRCAGNKEVNVAGTYISVKPDNSDRFGIMYMRGYFKFSYIGAGKDTLHLNDDGTFVYSKTYMDGELKRFEGSWERLSDHISLKYSDTLENENDSFKIAKNKIYHVHNITLCDTREKKHLLDLYKKQ